MSTGVCLKRRYSEHSGVYEKSSMATGLCPSLISRTVSVDVKHHVYLLDFVRKDGILNTLVSVDEKSSKATGLCSTGRYSEHCRVCMKRAPWPLDFVRQDGILNTVVSA